MCFPIPQNKYQNIKFDPHESSEDSNIDNSDSNQFIHIVAYHCSKLTRKIPIWRYIAVLLYIS